MHEGADIHALNTVRKHLSAIKGGRLAAACAGTTVTLAVSDVIGDDPAVIGSGPGVGDPTTWHDAAALVDRFGGAAHPERVRALMARGAAGRIEDTPKPGDRTLSRSNVHVIAGRQDAVAGARRAAEQLGYSVVVFADPIAGEARVASRIWLDRVRVAAAQTGRPLCVLSAGETTVRVSGTGTGGRNQEFVLALVDLLAESDGTIVASVGTDGIDGPTDAAGALADSSTLSRARDRRLRPPDDYLADNNAYEFFSALDDLLQLGRTDTNVGDLQLCLVTNDHG
jgi:hydroxypyruvate reductase